MIILQRLWRDEAGFVATTDLILMTTVLILGSLVGLVTFRDQVVQELGDLGAALGHLNQSYQYAGDGEEGVDDCWVAGSGYDDKTDLGGEDDTSGSEPAGISVGVGALDEGDPLPSP